jgi:biopolymer transport protein ExbD
MPIRKKKERDAPAITTASLPDIVFMLLCFFMVVTKMRDAEVKVKTQVPQAYQLEKLEKKSLVSQIYIGPPTAMYEGTMGTAPQIQLNDQFAKVQDIPVFVTNEKAKVLPVQIPELTAALRIDAEVKMKIITEVKTELRKSDFRRVSYLANQKVAQQ